MSAGTSLSMIARTSSARSATWSGGGGSSAMWRSVWRAHPALGAELVHSRPVIGDGTQHTRDRGLAQPAGGVHALPEARDLRVPVKLAHAALLDIGHEEAGGVGADVHDGDPRHSAAILWAPSG